MAQAQRGSWTVTAVNGVVAATVLVLVAVLALVVNPPAPPSIAAFAPQAAKPITKAPPGQSTQFGNGAGACADGQACAAGASPTPSAVPSATGAAALEVEKVLRGALPPGLQCYEWPDGSVTQTFDPQSPPCVSRWDDAKGNGGSTSPGVNGREIRVALPVATAASTWPTLQPIVDFFNTRFQLYGRAIKIVPVLSKQADEATTGDWNNPTLQKADAAQIAAQKVFATFDFMDPIAQSATLPVFLDAMAKAKIVSVNGGDITPFETATGLAKRAPYAWSFHPTVDQLLDNLGTMTCRQLVGKPAAHSTDAVTRAKTRKFVVYLPGDERLGGRLPGLDSLLATLKGCGAGDVPVVRKPTGTNYIASEVAQFQQLNSDGVTSVIFYPSGGNGQPGSPLVSAQQARFFPEWIIIGTHNYNTAYMLHDPQEETNAAFGVGIWNKQPQLALEPWHQAVIAVGGDPATAGSVFTGRGFYQEMLLLASGIQMAGPDLTPESFSKALHQTEFPNPGAAGEPFFQGTVGFPGSEATMVNDFTPFWLDTRTSGNQVQYSTAINQEKAFCMVGRGVRFRGDSWPGEDRFYQGTCR